MTWNHAKNFEVFGMGCSGLGSFRFSSGVPGDFSIQITFKALCSPAILLSFSPGHTYDLESVLYGILCVQFTWNIKLWCLWFGGAADLESDLYGTWKKEFEMWWAPPNCFKPGFCLLPALTNIRPGSKTWTYLNRVGFSVGGTHYISNSFFHVPYKLLSKSAARHTQNITGFGTIPSHLFLWPGKVCM